MTVTERRTVELEPVQRHVRTLMAAGWRGADIAKVSGVSVPSITRISTGRVKRVLIETADALMGTTQDMRYRGEPDTLVDGAGTRRRLQALARRGWSLAFLMRRIDRFPSQSHHLLTGKQVTLPMRELISGLYDDLWDVEPPQTTAEERRVYQRSVANAIRRGWVGPLAWDNIDADPEPSLGLEVKRCARDHKLTGANQLRSEERAKYRSCRACSEEIAAARTDNRDFDPHRADALYTELMPGEEFEIDHVAVDYALDGQSMNLSLHELREAVRKAHARRWSDVLISKRLRIADKTVTRIRNELGLPAWEQEDMITRDAA